LRRARARTTFSLRPARVRLPPRSGFFLSFWFLVFPRLSRGGDIVASRWLLRQQPGSYTCTPLTPTRQRMTRIRFGIGDFTVRQRPEVPVPRFALDNNCLNYVRNVRNGTIAASFTFKWATMREGGPSWQSSRNAPLGRPGDRRA